MPVLPSHTIVVISCTIIRPAPPPHVVEGIVVLSMSPARGISYTFHTPNQRKAQYKIGYMLTRQVDRRLVHHVTVRAPTRENADSDHNLEFGNVRLLCLIAPNRPRRVITNRRTVNLQRLLADPHLRTNFQQSIAAKLASPIPGTSSGSADDMTSVLTKTRLSNAADLAPPIRCKQVPRDWCAT